jgi:two-component system chemotaxis response regulator CheB
MKSGRGKLSEMKEAREHSDDSSFDIVAIASSAGGFDPVIEVVSGLPPDFPASVIVIRHLSPDQESHLAEILSRHTSLKVKEAKDGMRLARATVYTAVPNKHLMVNSDRTFSLASFEKVQFVRPAADVLFVTLAISCRNKVIAVILSGAGRDGAIGTLAVKRAGGKVIVQESPDVPGMPEAAIRIDDVDFVLPMKKIAPRLIKLVLKGRRKTAKKGKGEMTVKEAGRIGGEKTAETYGREFYEEIGHKGGKRVKTLIVEGKEHEKEHLAK